MKAKLKCCWNEETQDYFEMIPLGSKKYMCAGCGRIERVE